MKALIYKEFKLCMHPICYIFILVFPFMVLIPSYPISVGFIYVLSIYPILFLGANKGQQSNDLLYSTLLPVRKKDIVLARLITVIICQIVFTLIMACLLPLAYYLNDTLIDASAGVYEGNPGIGIDGFVSSVAIAMVGFAVADLIFFSIFYKKGRSIVLSTLLSITWFVLFDMVLTTVMPYLPGCEGYLNLLCYSGLFPQFIIFAIAFVIYIAVHFLTYKISSKELEKVDF